MDHEAEQGRRAVHGIFPANYVTLQQLKDKKEKDLQKQKEEEDDEKKKRQDEEKEKQVQRQKEEEEKKEQEQERRKLKGPSTRIRSSLPPNYVTLQQLKERKEQNLQREEEGGRNKQEEEENNKIGEQSLRPRRNGSGSGNKDPSDLEKKNLQQAAKNRCRETIAILAKDDPGRSGRWGRDGDRKAFKGSVRESPAHQKNGGAPSDEYPEDATVKLSVEKVRHGKASIGESAMKGSSDSEIQRTSGNGVARLRNKGGSATGKIAQLVSKGELVTTETVGLEAKGTSVAAIAVTAAPEEIEGKETKNEMGKERERPFRKRTKKKPENPAQASEHSVTATLEEEVPAVVPVTENVLADEDRARNGERGTPEKQKEKKGEGSVRGLQKDLARKMVLAASTNERQRRSWSRDSEQRVSLMWVKKGQIPGN